MSFLSFLFPQKKAVSECVGCEFYPCNLIKKYNGNKVFPVCPVKTKHLDGERRRHLLNAGLRNNQRI